ncbi:MAG: peptide chain release factor N(5)-glutamine methyltransferase [Candidatus Omnitrophica bacterium]|nr:peptide chain release factor N(5)-glutamine methyltransferase [Candidatus Omnitrophota bacterium]
MTDEELFLTALLGCTRSELYTHPPTLTEEQKLELERMKWRRAAGDPVQYICGFTEFLGHRIEVGTGVLIPRPETEVLADEVIRELKTDGQGEHFILDIGTGSGCLPVAIVKALPNCRAVALDISAEALVFARRNAIINGVGSRIECVKRDVFWFVDETSHRFDAVISNPPYIPTFMLERLPEDVRKEPASALDGGPDGLHFYRYIIPAAQRVLKTGGLIALEFGDGQRKELENLFAQTGGWDKIRIIKDNAGKSRVIMARRSAAVS